MQQESRILKTIFLPRSALLRCFYLVHNISSSVDFKLVGELRAASEVKTLSVRIRRHGFCVSGRGGGRGVMIYVVRNKIVVDADVRGVDHDPKEGVYE